MFWIFINQSNRLRHFNRILFLNQMKYFNNESNDVKIPEPPSTCCMSGCANCVWIDYAEELLKIFKDGKKSRDIVMEKVTDPNMKAFLLTELASLKSTDDDSNGGHK